MLSRRERTPRAALARPKGISGRFAYGSFRCIAADTPNGAAVAPKKVFKTSVVRNAARRKVLTALRLLIRSGAIRGGIIVYPSKDVARASSADIAAALKDALAKGTR